MATVLPNGRVFLAVAGGLVALGLAAGIVQSFRVERRLPAVDLLAAGATRYIDYLVAHQDYDGAIEQLHLQTRLQPYDAANYEDLGALLGSQKRPEDARAQFQTLVDLRPDYAEGYNLLGSTYLETNELEMAQKCFLRAIELKPEFPLALNNLGMTVAQSGKLDLAEACFEKAVRLAPDYGEARANLEWAREQLRAKR